MPCQTQPQEPRFAELGLTVICLAIELAASPGWLGAGGSFCQSQPGLRHAAIHGDPHHIGGLLPVAPPLHALWL